MARNNDELDAVKSRGKLSSGENTRRIALIALFGVAVFTSKAFLPSPIDKVVVAVQALFLALGSLLSKRFGATLVAAIGAALTIFLRPSLAPLTIAFALIYGLLTDGFILIFHAKASGNDVRARRLVTAVTLSTAITGLASYYVTVHVLALLPRNLVLEITILVVGVISGLLGGCLAVLIWRRALRHIVVMKPLRNRGSIGGKFKRQLKKSPKYNRKFSIWLGTVIGLVGSFLGFLILSIINITFHPATNLLLLLAAWFCFWFFPHCLTHLIVGKLLGIDFHFYFVGRSSLVKLNLPIISLFAKHVPILGIKINQESFLRVAPQRRAIMFASGAIASMTLPMSCVVYAFMYMPAWIATPIGILTVGNICFTLVYSSKVGDLQKAKRTLKL